MTRAVSSLFTPRTSFKPFEYPELVRFKYAIQESYWRFQEFNFDGDIQDYRVSCTDVEQSAIKNALLAISQVEVAVKRFWSKTGERFGKAEIEQVGVTFADSEVRHADAYSHLLEVLNLNDEFDGLGSVPAIAGRVAYLQKQLAAVGGPDGRPGISGEEDARDFARRLALFSVNVENVSLFGLFLVIQSFWKYRTLLKDIDNVVQATRKEETVHALFGVRLIEMMREEKPEWFGDDFARTIQEACREAFVAESAITDWVFSAGDLDFLSAAQVKEFLKGRFNDSLVLLGIEPIFDVDEQMIAPLAWFDVEGDAEVSTDFFHKKPVTYSKMTQSVGADDLF